LFQISVNCVTKKEEENNNKSNLKKPTLIAMYMYNKAFHNIVKNLFYFFEAKPEQN
jgi:hypothetical protein